MTVPTYTELAWLPRAPAGFADICRQLAGEPAPGSAVQALAGHGLDADQLGRLGRVIMRAQADGRSLLPLQPLRLGLIGNGTLDLVGPVLVASAARHGFALECVKAEYGQLLQQVLDPASQINMFRPHVVLLAMDHHGLPLHAAVGEIESEDAGIDAAIGQLLIIRQAIHDNAGAVCIVQTLATPPEALFGNIDRMVPGTDRAVIGRLNRAIADSMAGSEDLLLDVAALAETVGTAAWHSPALWNMAKLAFDPSCLPLYADHVGRVLAAWQGRSRKCLVLDLDNTVWGGVIGDDGLEGIKLAQGDATGEAHLAVQLLALRLRERGVVLAVSSKNTDEVARMPFRTHPDMLLREDHIAVFQANWNDKASNIQAIAEELSLGLDAMVFLDDNPVERGLVRQTLPQVAVPELPDDPAWFPRILAAAGYFESVAFSSEDGKRAEMYQANARRATLKTQVGDLDGYLASLDMEIRFAPFDKVGRSRISQLINKSNQFNLTTRRYSEVETAAAELDPDVFTLQVRLADTFGDNGMISVVICRPTEPRTWEIDTWLMSCRVLGRRVEQMVLHEIIRNARHAGVDRIVGRYVPSAKNALVHDHFAKLGFASLGQMEEATLWSLPTSTEIAQVAMRILHSDAAALAA